MDMIEIKINNNWHTLQTLDKRVNPKYFRIVWDDLSPSFRAIIDASFNQTQQSFRLSGTEVLCWVEVSMFPHLEPDLVMYATATLTPTSGEHQATAGDAVKNI